MTGMLDGDKFIFDPLHLFTTRLDTKLPGKQKTLRERADEEVVAAVLAWVKKFEPLAQKEKRANDAQREIEKHEKVLTETKYLAKEMSLAIQLAIVRHAEFEPKLKPRLGATPDDHVQNLVDMRKRLNDHASELKEEQIVVKLEARHADAPVARQAALHAVAQTALDLLEKSGDSEQGELVALRREGRLLQTRVNQQLVAAIPGNRPAQVLFGYSERESSRPSSEEKDKKDEQKTESTEKPAEKKTKGKDKKKKKDAEANTKGNPPGPGPVAAGSGQVTPAEPPKDASAAAAPPASEAPKPAASPEAPPEVPPAAATEATTSKEGPAR